MIQHNRNEQSKNIQDLIDINDVFTSDNDTYYKQCPEFGNVTCAWNKSYLFAINTKAEGNGFYTCKNEAYENGLYENQMICPFNLLF